MGGGECNHPLYRNLNIWYALQRIGDQLCIGSQHIGKYNILALLPWIAYLYKGIRSMFLNPEYRVLNSKERYISFMKRCPDELRIIPQKYLASYLNMKPETFSRLRASVYY